MSSRRSRIVILSDLHMATGAGPLPDPFAEDAALVAVLAALVENTSPIELVLLGDTFDLVAAGASPTMRLDAVAAAHLAVFGALAAFVRAGHSLELVPGSHDADLWSSIVRRGRDGAQDRMCSVEIEHGGGRLPTARLRRWEGALR